MRLLVYLFLFLQVGCATKYIIPGNRFVTPESQGGVFRSSFEFQQTAAHQLAADVGKRNVDEGVTSEDVRRSGFLLSSSLLDQVDLFWNHTGGGNSLLGAKFQFMGAARTANGTGHKMAISAAFGGNEHETDESPSVLFTLNAQEFQLLYGFRFSEWLLAYTNLSYGKYSFNGKIDSKDPAIDGLKPSYDTRSISLLGGVELGMGPFFAKLETGYQQLKTTDTENETAILMGYSVGITW